MKHSERIAILYGLSVLGAGAVSYYQGRRGADMAIDAALYGALAGTGINVVWWLSAEGIPQFAQIETAKPNEGPSGMGKLSGDAVKLLSQVDAAKLYQNLKENGVKIAPVPDNPSIVTPDAD